MDFVKTFVCVPKTIVETQVGSLCGLLNDDVVKIIESTTSNRWWSECHAEKCITSDAPNHVVSPSRPKGRRMSLLEKISEVYEKEMDGSKRPHQGIGSQPRNVIDHSQLRVLLQNDLLPQDVEPQPSVKPFHNPKKITENPVVAGSTHQNRNSADTSGRGFKLRYALLADHSRKEAASQQARLLKMQTESYIQRIRARSAPDSKLIISGAGRRPRRPHPTDD